MKIFAISLGCAKNSIDTELILGALYEAPGGMTLVHQPEDADVILVNTCGFLESAVQESIDAILEIAQLKGQGQVLAVSGCMVQRYGEELERELEEVDIFHGTQAPEQMAHKILERLSGLKGSAGSDFSCIDVAGRIITTPPWRAYVKISEGCSNHCTYCLIPAIRGKNWCRKPGDIVAEVGKLADSGVREVTLLAQDLTAYRHGEVDLEFLVNALLEETSIPWIRLLYLHPKGISHRLLELIAENQQRICPYLDVPVQHASSNILRRMGREYNAAYLEKLFRNIRSVLPEAALRTTVMTGFPGETEDDFRRLLDFIQRWRFTHLGCFAYSDEEGCAASRLGEKVAPEIASARKEQVMELQADISASVNRELVGSVQKVLVEGISDETDLLLQARTMFQAPEVDGITYIAEGQADAGDIVNAEITDSHVYDLVARIV